MKTVLVHWVEMRTLEIPDECPTESTDQLEKWLIDNSPLDIDHLGSKSKFVSRVATRDFEIVDVQNA